MIVITVKWEEEKGKDKPLQPASVLVRLSNTQWGLSGDALLRSGEAVEHRLRLDQSGVIALEIRG